jgi:heme exporter protein A
LIASIAIDGLSVSRGARRLFDGLSLEVKAGEAVMLVGANGAGKTSLLRAIAGLLRPDSGAVSFLASDGQVLDPDEARSHGLHFVGHHDGLKTQRKAGEEFAFWADWMGGSEEGRTAAIDSYDLKPLLDLDVRVLSAGQRRRLALSRLKAAPRSLWLLDEPLAPLDARWRAAMGLEMAHHLQGGGLILAAAHDPLPVPHRTVEVGA